MPIPARQHRHGRRCQRHLAGVGRQFLDHHSALGPVIVIDIGTAGCLHTAIRFVFVNPKTDEGWEILIVFIRERGMPHG